MINLRSEKIVIKASCVSYMMDRKASNLYLGLGGAYCDLCVYAKTELLDELLIREGIEITRSFENLHNICNDLPTGQGTILKRE